jgi:hypothetical protein
MQPQAAQPRPTSLLSFRAGLSSRCGRHPVCLRGERARFPAWGPSAASPVIPSTRSGLLAQTPSEPEQGS